MIWPKVVQIGCPQCQTHYALDDRLVPPGGAPVQCTRCGHVFIAYRPGEGPAATTSPKAEPSPPAKTGGTQVFGGTPPGTNPTPAFGTTKPASSTSPGNRTQVFGTQTPLATPATPPAPSAGNRTQVFGSQTPVATPAAPAPSAGNRTQVFGSQTPLATAAAAPPSAGNRTQVFGTQTPLATPAAPPPTGGTQVFGAPPPPAGAPAPAGAANRTQVFGGPPAPTPAPPGQAGAGRAQVFGSGGPTVPPRPEGAEALQPRAPAVPSPTPPSAGGTQFFGAPTPPLAARPRATTGADVSPGAPVLQAPAPDVAPNRAAGTVFFGGAAAPPPSIRSGGVSLPPEQPGISSAPPLPGLNLPGFEGRTATRGDAAEMALRRQYQRRNRLALAVILAIVLVGGGVAAFRVLLPTFQSAPAAAVVEEEAAFAQLRKDDPTSRASAVARLRALVVAQPHYVEAQAALALALLLDLDDRRASLQRYTREAEALTTQKARLEAERSGPDWRVQANRLVDKISALKAKSDPLFEDAKGLQAQANAAYAALAKLEAVTPSEQLARTRTEAIFNAMDGRDQAIILAERYRQMGGQDGWADVANAEYALNTRVTPETTTQALDSMRALQKRDTTFLRAYVLGGRLALQLKQRELATSQFEAALALNPNHVLAQTLADEARSAEQRP